MVESFHYFVELIPIFNQDSFQITNHIRRNGANLVTFDRIDANCGSQLNDENKSNKIDPSKNNISNPTFSTRKLTKKTKTVLQFVTLKKMEKMERRE